MYFISNTWILWRIFGVVFSDEHLNATVLHDYTTENQTTNSDQQVQTTDEPTQTEIQELMAENLTIC
jgi:hypothetical protein